MKKQIKITGVRKIASESVCIIPYRTYQGLYYNEQTGEAWANDYVGSVGESWTCYDDENVIFCGYIEEKIKMREVKDMISHTLMIREMKAQEWQD